MGRGANVTDMAAHLNINNGKRFGREITVDTLSACATVESVKQQENLEYGYRS